MARGRVSKKLTHLTTQFARLLNERRMTNAEKVLATIKEELKPTPFHSGYYNALEGMLTALKAKDNRYIYITQINSNDQKQLSKLRREFSKQSRSSLQNDFDKGYYSAWLEYIQAFILPKRSGKLNEYLENQSSTEK